MKNEKRIFGTIFKEGEGRFFETIIVDDEKDRR